MGRWAWSKRRRRALNSEAPLNSCLEPWTVRLEGTAPAAIAGTRVPRGPEEFSPSRPPQAQGMDSARGARLGGAEAWSLAEVWALAGSLRGPGFSLAWPPPSSGTGRTPRLQPPGHRPLSCAARLRRRAGTEPADRAGQCRHQGSIIHGAPGRAPKTSSVLGFSGGVETTRGKSSQSKVGHISYFPK